MRTNKQIINSALSEINHAYQITDRGYLTHDLRIRVETITNILYSLGYDDEVVIIREYVQEKIYKRDVRHNI